MEWIGDMEVCKMESKKWWWVVIVCLVVVTAYQVVKIARVEPAQPQAPQEEPVFQPDRQTAQTASLSALPSMPAESAKPAPEPAKVEEQELQSTPPEPTEEASAPMPEEQPQHAEEPAEEQNPPAPETDLRLQQGGQAPGANSAGPEQTVNIADEAELAPGASPRGLVRGIVYSGDSGSALVDDTIVHAGATIDGVKVVRVHANGVDFEKNGQRWTQKVSETPNPLWH